MSTTPPTTRRERTTDAGLVAARLRAFVEGDADVVGTVEGVRRAGSGRSRDNWLFDLVDGERREELILRTDPEGGLVDTDRAVEFAVLGRLAGSGLPTPVARWLDADGHAFGRPSLVMQRLPGVCDYRVLGREGLPVEERAGLARAFCELLAAVHAVDWRALDLGSVLTDPGPGAARAALDGWTAVLRADRVEPWPELEYAAAVLADTAPASAATALVHADFKPGNILLDDGRVSALLDWELAHLGDPLEDLGWVTQPLRAGEHTVPGAWEAVDLVAHYERVTGAALDRGALGWWRAFSAYKTAVMQVSGLRAFLEGRAEEPYRPTRRVLATLLDAVEDAA